MKNFFPPSTGESHTQAHEAQRQFIRLVNIRRKVVGAWPIKPENGVTCLGAPRARLVSSIPHPTLVDLALAPALDAPALD